MMFDLMFLALIPSLHSTYHLPLLAINGIIFGLHYARYQESFSFIHESLYPLYPLQPSYGTSLGPLGPSVAGTLLEKGG